MLYSCAHMSTVGVKGLTHYRILSVCVAIAVNLHAYSMHSTFYLKLLPLLLLLLLFKCWTPIVQAHCVNRVISFFGKCS